MQIPAPIAVFIAGAGLALCIAALAFSAMVFGWLDPQGW